VKDFTHIPVLAYALTKIKEFTTFCRQIRGISGNFVQIISKTSGARAIVPESARFEYDHLWAKKLRYRPEGPQSAASGQNA
jgi:hypothetical protein